MNTPTHEFHDGNDYPGGAERACLPAHIGGYQHLEPDVAVGYHDICVCDGRPVQFTGDRLCGFDVGTVEKLTGYNIYRRLAVAKQGDNDDTGWKKVAAKGEGQSAAPLPADAQARKRIPIATGFCDYFPRAIAAIAAVSLAGNEQHNPGKPLHWDRSKSGDEADALMRHFLQRGTVDSDGIGHSQKMAWRAMALLEKELENQ